MDENMIMNEVILHSYAVDIAKVAYGSGVFEGHHGGAGNIGLLNDRVIKFNTHRSERGGAVTDEMHTSCNDLRLMLARMINFSLGEPSQDPAVNARNERIKQNLYAKLGLNSNGDPMPSSPLLERKIVASVISTLCEREGFVIWSGLRAKAVGIEAFSSEGMDTTFDAVKARLENKEGLDKMPKLTIIKQPERPAVPEESSHAVVEEPSLVVAEEPSLVVAEESNPAVAEESSPAVPEEPIPAVPEESIPVVAEESSSAVPEEASPVKEQVVSSLKEVKCPDLDTLMEEAEDCINHYDRDSFKESLAKTPDIERFSLATIRQDLVAEYKQMSQDLWDRHERALMALDSMKKAPGATEEIKLRAKGLLEQLELATDNLLKQDPDDEAPSIEKLSNFIWAIVESVSQSTQTIAQLRMDSPAQLVQSNHPTRSGDDSERGVVRDACEMLNDATQGANSLYQKIRQATTIVKLRRNLADGSCFFYSALQQMTNAEFNQILLNKDRAALNGQYSDNQGCILAFRRAFVRHSQNLMKKMKDPATATSMPLVTYDAQNNGYNLNLPDTMRDQKSLQIDLTRAMKQIDKGNFTDYRVQAEVSQAAFLADFLKRPVTLIMEMPGWRKEGDERVETTGVDYLTCTHSLSDGSKLEGEPIMIYFKRSPDGKTGHYETLLFEGPGFDN